MCVRIVSKIPRRVGGKMWNLVLLASFFSKGVVVPATVLIF